MAKICALSTSDNPYNPFKEYDLWNAFDTRNGYNSAAYLARQVGDVSGEDQNEILEDIENAINRIVALNLTGNYIKVYAN